MSIYSEVFYTNCCMIWGDVWMKGEQPP